MLFNQKKEITATDRDKIIYNLNEECYNAETRLKELVQHIYVLTNMNVFYTLEGMQEHKEKIEAAVSELNECAREYEKLAKRYVTEIADISDRNITSEWTLLFKTDSNDIIERTMRDILFSKLK